MNVSEKVVKIFLASSDEFVMDRVSFGDYINQLNNIYHKRGIFLELLKWESFNASLGTGRKQNEYNEKVRSSDLFLALFHTKAGEYTLEEFDTALDEFSKSKPDLI